MKTIITFSVTVLFFCIVSVSNAQDFYVYPAKGQSQEQTEKDKFECYGWAKNQTGFDPMQVPTASSPPPAPEAQQGGVGRGAVGGAVGGAVIGAIAGDAGTGAAIGAVGGGLIGGMRRNEQRQREQHNRQQWEQQQTQQYAQARTSYNRAYVACLEARGYSVK